MQDIIFYVNEFGNGVSFHEIPNATSMEMAKSTYNDGNGYYHPTYNGAIDAINENFGQI